MSRFRTGLLVSITAATIVGCGPPESRYPAGESAVPDAKLVDLTYPFDSTTLYWSPDEKFRVEVVARGMTEAGYWYASNRICASEHGGTHLDAPNHFAEGGWTTAEIPIERLAGPACVIDVAPSCASDPDYRLTVEDIAAWEKRNGPIPKGAIVLMRSGWGARWPDRARYFGATREGDTKSYHFPGYSKDAAEFLTHERSVDAVGLDTPSLDHGPSADFAAHRVFGAANVPGLENVASLDRIPETGATILALPIKITGGTGGPARIVAILP
jgi:kynurenine formamidase